LNVIDTPGYAASNACFSSLNASVSEEAAKTVRLPERSVVDVEADFPPPLQAAASARSSTAEDRRRRNRKIVR
jgi:hypothetical protein